MPFEALQDPYGIEFWPEFKGRDGCRTPMVWDANATNGGFSDGQTWLPVADQHLTNTPLAQVGVDNSIYSHYQQSIAMRKAYPALAQGDMLERQATDKTLTFKRELDGQVLFCAFNLSDDSADISLPAGEWQVVDQQLDGLVAPTGNQVNLQAWQYVVVVQA